jgi:hypothetical protein
VNGLTLTEEKLILAKQYIDLLETVEEAFDYIEESFKNLSYTEGDRLLNDIFHAFSQIISTNFILAENFKTQPTVLITLAQFVVVVEKAEMLEEKFADQTAIQKIILEHLYPSYSAWKLSVEQELRPYIQV